MSADQEPLLKSITSTLYWSAKLLKQKISLKLTFYKKMNEELDINLT